MSPRDQAIDRIRRWRQSVAVFALEAFGFAPDPWQAEVFGAWDRGDQRLAMQACKGPGKTAVLAILVWHFLATRLQPKVAATSITADNLRDCLWTELAKWQAKSPFLQAAFEWRTERIIARDHPETWWASARSWSRTANAEQQGATMAGLHADAILFVLDEAGGIPTAILNSAEASLSSGQECRLLMAGNPIEVDGALGRACLRDRHLWTVVEITGDPDSPRRSTRISVQWARDQIAQYGADNPWVQANVFGRFSSASPLAFIPADLVHQATQREATAQVFDPMILGVEVARFGDDEAGIFYRKGRDARTFHNPQDWFRHIDTMQFASRVAERAEAFKADGVFIDGGGVGGGVVDRCRQLRVQNIFDIQFGGKADRAVIPGTDESMVGYVNKSSEMWGQMRGWLKTGSIPDDPVLVSQLTSRRYAFVTRDGRDVIALEPKDAMRARGLGSPDRADALCLTFAYPIQQHRYAGGYGLMNQGRVVTDYDHIAAALDPQQAQGRVVTDWNPYE